MLTAILDSRLVLILSFVLTFIFTPTPARAEFQCPKSIGVIENDVISEQSAERLIQAYAALNCPVSFLQLPPRRSIMEFNAGRLDGELHRFDLIEERYTRPFTRSEEPLFSLIASRYQHPDSEITRTRPFGYTIGLIWQENYISETKIEARRFQSEEEMLEAYAAGKLSGFLTDNIVLKLFLDANPNAPLPIEAERIWIKPLYHYLGSEFSSFMVTLSDYLQNNRIFADFEPE